MDNRTMELTLARMAKEFLPYSIDQRLLLPPDMRDWLPEAHWALFVNCISDFRKRHLKALGALFAQVLVLCQKAGLVKLGRTTYSSCIDNGPRKP